MITLMTPLRVAAKICPEREALVVGSQRLSYRTFYQQSRRLAQYLLAAYHLSSGQSVGVLCRNHLLQALLLPALSRLGVHTRLINTDIPAQQLATLLDGRYSLLIYDTELCARCQPDTLPCKAVTAEALLAQLQAVENPEARLPFFTTQATLSVYTGGTSGNYKEVSRTTGVMQFLLPFWTLLRHIGLHRYQSVLIALPFYHGFGLSTFIVSLILCKKICLLPRFDTRMVLETICHEQIEVLPVVPAMLSRIWQIPEAQESLHSVRCIISGGDRLSLVLAEKTQSELGPVLYNLFGTTEAGFFLLARPEDLCAEDVIGRPIPGVKCEIREPDQQGVGDLWVRCGWAMTGRKNCWQQTGDLASMSPKGCYIYHGRADRMVVCGGENVSIDHVEQVLLSHPSVSNVSVYAAPHPDFGQVLHARVESASSATVLSADELRAWLSVRLSRAEMPHQFIFAPIEVLSTGKRSAVPL